MSPSGGKRGSINLTALGSAAVIAIYAAGYMRTRPAAKKFEGSDSSRRPTPVVVPQRPVAADSAQVVVTPVPTGLASPTTPEPKPAPKAKKETPAAEPKPSQDKPAPADTSTPIVSQPLPATVDTTTKPAADSVKVLKDGTYTGWGTSRHGDIEAAVEIKEGRIVNAYITQCLTRYSCGRIASIIPQVVARQSPEVDYVSGATQSTDAFYYAIVQALSKAK